MFIFEKNLFMKKLITFSALFLFVFSFSQSLSNIKAKNILGKTIDVDALDDEKPLVISFWATWCLPCLEELRTINEKLPDWKAEKDFNFIAISTDDPRTVNKVKTLINGKNWEFDQVLLDPSQTIKRQLNINNIPSTMVYYKGKLIYSHVGFAPGDEDELFEKVKALQ